MEKPILVISRLDVVEAQPEDWTLAPFKLTGQERWLYGRGIQDVKNQAAAEVFLLQMTKPALTIRVLLGNEIQEIVNLIQARIADPCVKATLLDKPRPNPASPLRPDLMTAVERTTVKLWPSLPVYFT